MLDSEWTWLYFISIITLGLISMDRCGARVTEETKAFITAGYSQCSPRHDSPETNTHYWKKDCEK